MLMGSRPAISLTTRRANNHVEEVFHLLRWQRERAIRAGFSDLVARQFQHRRLDQHSGTHIQLALPNQCDDRIGVGCFEKLVDARNRKRRLQRESFANKRNISLPDRSLKDSIIEFAFAVQSLSVARFKRSALVLTGAQTIADLLAQCSKLGLVQCPLTRQLINQGVTDETQDAPGDLLGQSRTQQQRCVQAFIGFRLLSNRFHRWIVNFR